MTQKDGSPEASEGPYWSEELLAVLVVGLGDETQARDTLEGIIRQALSDLFRGSPPLPAALSTTALSTAERSEGASSGVGRSGRKRRWQRVVGGVV